MAENVNIKIRSPFHPKVLNLQSTLCQPLAGERGRGVQVDLYRLDIESHSGIHLDTRS